MTREEKCKLAIERGFTYGPETGLIYNKKNKYLTGISSSGYIQICIKINKKTISLLGHHFAWYYINKECINDKEIDHINGIKSDNRISNLRLVTPQQNQCNHVNAKGYCWNKKQQKFQAYICINYKTKHLGCFNTEQEARNAYLAAKEIYHKF